MYYHSSPWQMARHIGREAFKNRVSRNELIELNRGHELLSYIVRGWDTANKEYQDVLSNGASPSG